MANGNEDPFDVILDTIEQTIINHKKMIASVILILIACFILNCLFGFDKPFCSDSIVDMKSLSRECFNGAKLKFISNQWICSCEK